MSVTLTASPRGARIGFTAAGSVDHQIVLSVAPKTWRPPNTATVVHVPEWPARRHHELTLYELDRLHVTADHPAMDALLTSCLEASRRTQQGAVRWDSSLLAPDVRPRNLHTVRSLDGNNQHVTTDLLQLFDRLNFLAPRPESLHGASGKSPLHRPLLCRRFLDEVLARTHAIRRGYRTVVAPRIAVRGRIDASSAVRYAATGDPRLTCRYDELTESTELLGIVCAALERIADGLGMRSPFAGRFAEQQLRHDAVTLRRALSGVATVPPATALRIGPRLHLNRLDQPWVDALRLALALLAEIEFVAAEADRRFADAIELSFPTDKIWEKIVYDVLSRSHFTKVLAQAALPANLVADPWVDNPLKPSESRPDNVAWHGPTIWIADAKYKTLAASKPPDRNDQYQMFAYTHLLDDTEGNVERALLIYPGEGTTRTWRRGRDAAPTPVRLSTVRIPFPQPEDARTATAWDTYLDQSANRFREVTTPLSTPL
ncbi:5-methylcytosine restriction system specificity protein McrC [Dactylosporangium sp. CA-152071]|uniref:5-methylcytosine restriction system specificity protein McrC n=1 Tax=Dactylosporangium sp. CA-152071 TaxID=3239933 RepID=UPI003D90359D